MNNTRESVELVLKLNYIHSVYFNHVSPLDGDLGMQSKKSTKIVNKSLSPLTPLPLKAIVKKNTVNYLLCYIFGWI